jgi:hypothetical protein
MDSKEFPHFVKSLPEADLPFVGLRGWLLQSDNGQVLFNESDVELAVTEHKHGEQWGLVVAGKIEMTIGGQKRVYVKGDTYFVPANVLHSATIYPGFRAVDYFADKSRYKRK